MRTLLRPLILSLFLFQAFFLSAQSNIDVMHYRFRVNLNDKNDTIYGITEIKLRAIQTVYSLNIDLDLLEGGKGMIVDSVKPMYGPRIKIFGKQNDQVKILLNAPLNIGDSAIFRINYHGIPRDGLIISKNKFGDRTFFADNWPNRAHNWIPCVDEPRDKSSFEFIVTAPSAYRVISNGILQEEKLLADDKKLTHWKETIPLPTKVMVIGVAKFAVKKYADSPTDIPVTAWTYPQDSVKGFRNYSTAPKILKFFSDYVGPYPYKKLANVQSKTMFGGMENASAIFYYEESAAQDASVEDLVAHEIAHQWFGDMATEKTFSHLWLSEGFATYLTDVYIEAEYGNDSMNSRLKTERRTVINFARSSGKPIVDSTSDFMSLLNANSYQKGAWVLHMLRRQVGDSLFRLFIRSYYDRYKGKNANSEDLLALAEEVTKKDLKTFFKQWLYTPGIPQLNVEWKYKKDGKKIQITVKQIQKQGIYQFPLEIRLQAVSGKSNIEILTVTKREETFSIPVKEAIYMIYLDPNVSLLYDGKIEKKSS